MGPSHTYIYCVHGCEFVSVAVSYTPDWYWGTFTFVIDISFSIKMFALVTIGSTKSDEKKSNKQRKPKKKKKQP